MLIEFDGVDEVDGWMGDAGIGRSDGVEDLPNEWGVERENDCHHRPQSSTINDGLKCCCPVLFARNGRGI